MKKIITLSIFIVVFSSVAIAGNPSEYNKGANDALTAIMLLDLELKLTGERKSWGEMADIVRERLRVPKPDNQASSADTKSRKEGLNGK